jgi:ankyrin repeat protein
MIIFHHALLQNHDKRPSDIRLHCSMKMKFILTVLVSLAASGLAAASTNDLTTPLQRGLFEEEANHQLDAAIVNYKEAIEHFDHERQLAATAVFRLGECYRKLGRTNEANAQYARIVREFPDQTQLAQLSQSYLPVGAAVVAASTIESSALPPDEDKFLREVKESVQNSPDLVNQQLFTAAENGYVSAAEFLIAHGADVSLPGPMVAAARKGNEAMVQLLFSHGAAVDSRDDSRDNSSSTPLFFAVQNGFMTVCRTLVAHGADVNAKNKNGSTPLQIALDHGNLPAAEFLISNKAQPSPDLMNGELLMAAQNGQVSKAEFLLAHGADVNLRSPIVAAATQGNDAMVRLLLSHGAKVDSRGDGGRTALGYAMEKGFMDVCHTLVAHGADVNAKDVDTKTPLQIAVEKGNIIAAEFLITNKAQIDIRRGDGLTPLTTAIIMDQIDMVKLLLDNHADANMETGPSNGARSPLRCAIDKHNAKIVQLLLDHGAKPNAADIEALVDDSSQGNIDMVRMLIEHGADVNAKTSQGKTPLLMAMEQGDTNMVKFLLDSHADANMESIYGGRVGPFRPTVSRPVLSSPLSGPLSPLLWAIENSHAQMVQLLLDHGAKPNTMNIDGDTALMHAITHRDTDMVRLLIEHGADVNLLDKQGRPPLAQLTQPGILSSSHALPFPGIPGVNGLSDTGPQIEALLIKAGADPDYNRRRAIWTCGDNGRPKEEIFQCPTNSINHYTLLEFLAALYQAVPGPGFGRGGGGGPGSSASYAHADNLVRFPDFARVEIHRLDGKRAQVLHVNVADILRSGDDSKDVALRAGDMVEIPEQEHKVADRWVALSQADVIALNKYLLRTVHRVSRDGTNDIALSPSLGVLDQTSFMPFRGNLTTDLGTNWLAEALKGRKADTVVRSFLLNAVVRDANVLLNTWDLTRVRLKRGGAKMTFDLTANPPPDVWLEDGDVIEIPELGEAPPATEAKETPQTRGIH